LYHSGDRSRCLLALRYQFNPHLYNPDVVVNILIKALTSPSTPDFNLCLALLGERPLSAVLEEPDPLPALLPSLTELHALLQQCRFPRFWELYRSDDLELLRDNYTVEVAGFEESVRELVVRSVRATFKRIGGARLGSYLALGGES
jgi:translation initiation factor 3 subunit K